eukprot:5193564-Alexandrium_andersonii.AAC.1
MGQSEYPPGLSNFRFKDVSVTTVIVSHSALREVALIKLRERVHGSSASGNLVANHERGASSGPP